MLLRRATKWAAVGLTAAQVRAALRQKQQPRPSQEAGKQRPHPSADRGADSPARKAEQYSGPSFGAPRPKHGPDDLRVSKARDAREREACRGIPGHPGEAPADTRGMDGTGKPWILEWVLTERGLREYLGMAPRSHGEGAGSDQTGQAPEVEEAEAEPPPGGHRPRKGRRDREDPPGDEDREGSPPERDHGSELGLADAAPICCSCGKGGARAMNHSIRLDHATMVTRPLGSRSRHHVGICLVPSRVGMIRPKNRDIRMCGHTPCEECTRWVAGAPMCACCAHRTGEQGSPLSGAGRLPSTEDGRNRARPALPAGGAGSGAPPSARGTHQPPARMMPDLTPATGRRTRSRMPPRERSRTPAASRSGIPPGASGSRSAPDIDRDRHEDSDDDSEGTEEEEAEHDHYDEEETDRWDSGRGRERPPEPPRPPPRGKGDHPAWDWHVCDVRGCNRPSRGGDSVCCDPCVRTHGRDHTFNCDARVREAQGPARGPNRKGGGAGGPGGKGGGPGSGRRPDGRPKRKKPGKTARDRERNMFRKGGGRSGKSGKGRPFSAQDFRRALSLGTAASTVRSQTSRLKTWDKALEDLESKGLLTLPEDRCRLSPETAKAGVAYLRSRGYRSAELYLSSAVTRHKSRYDMSGPLQSAHQEAVRISRRGVGPARGKQPIPMPPPHTPHFEALSVGIWFLLRVSELTSLNVGDVRQRTGSRFQVGLWIRSSKTDQEAAGSLVCRDCVCEDPAAAP